MQNEFVGRENEIQLIKNVIKTKHPTITAIYGRRRVGKTRLIQQVLKERRTLFFEGLEDRSKKEQISNFIFQLETSTLRKHGHPIPNTWREALLLLHEEVKKKPAVIVFDEFQWMANYRKDIVSDLKMMWDRFFSLIPGVHLILCGSIASFMLEKVIRSKALYGRVDRVIHLRPFKINETAKLMRKMGIQEILDAHILTGGIPKYLLQIIDAPSVVLGMNESAFKESGYLYREFERIFTSHFGKNHEFEKIIRVLAANPYGLSRNELIAQTNSKNGGQFTKHVLDLELAGFIRSQSLLNSNKKSNKKNIS